MVISHREESPATLAGSGARVLPTASEGPRSASARALSARGPMGPQPEEAAPIVMEITPQPVGRAQPAKALATAFSRPRPAAAAPAGHAGA